MPVRWDAGARRHAYDQTRALAADDPEAAALLRAHLAGTNAGSGALPTPLPPASSPADEDEDEDEAPGYDPMRLYAQVVRAAHWTIRDCDETHFPTFFGLVRELTLLAEEEQAAADRVAGGKGAGDRASGDITHDPDLAAIMRAARRPMPFPRT